MQGGSEFDDPDGVDPLEYLREKEEYEDKRDDFMRKHLRRAWPVRIVFIIGVLQLLISLAILGVDLPVVLMFAPRWQVFAGCWTFVFTFMACVSTLHSIRRMTWLKLKWTVGLNLLGAVSAAIMVAFDILYLVNPYICIIAGGCNYLSYTYSAVKSYYTGQVILGIGFIVTVFVLLLLFIRNGIGGITLFENIQKGWAAGDFNPIVPPHGFVPVQQAPMTGAGIFMNRPPAPSGPPPGSFPRYPAAGPGVMMNGPPRPMMPPGHMMGAGPRGPMMPMGPRGPMMPMGPRGPMMPPGSRGPMMPPMARGPIPGYYRQPGPYPPAAYP